VRDEEIRITNNQNILLSSVIFNVVILLFLFQNKNMMKDILQPLSQYFSSFFAPIKIFRFN